MTKIIKLIFLILIVLIQGYGIINEPLDSQNQLELTEKIKLPELSDRWALIVGVSNYKDTNIRDLNYADKDASSFYNSLIEKCRFKKEQIKILLNKDATYENIRKSISGWLFKNTQKNDKITIFFSGHGYRDIDNNDDEDDAFDEFLIPFDYQSSDISSAIRDDEFAYWINSLRTENILLVLDSCFSGGAAKAKGIINENISIKGDVKIDNFAKDIFGEVPRAGVSLLGASKAEQISFEEPKLKMGIFTYFLIDSMDKRSDMNLDNKISIKELFDNLKPKVLKYSKANYKREQEPILIDTMKNPFDLVYIPIELNGSAGKNSAKIKNLLSKANLATDRNRKIEILEECCKLDPKNEEIHAQLALQLYLNKNYDEAIYHYEIAISIALNKKSEAKFTRDRHLSNYYGSISKVYGSKGLFEEAKQHIQKAISIRKAMGLNKFDTRFFNQLGDLYYKNNELSEAIQTYLYSIQMDEIQDEVYFNLSRIYTKQMKYEEALSILEKAININPDYSNFYYLKGLIIKYINNDIDWSEKLFKRFFDLNEFMKTRIELISIIKEVDGKRSSEVILILEKTIKELDYYAEAYIDL
jgi:tetratricopeptide (TPR) repeat protein